MRLGAYTANLAPGSLARQAYGADVVIDRHRHRYEVNQEFLPKLNEATPYKVIYKLRDLLGVDDLGGTMRLGAYPANLAEGSLARQAYGEEVAIDRHRHRYEVNQEFLPKLVAAGMKVSGLSPDGKFVEIVEYAGHPWFLACQFHPEYKSRPLAPHPLFREFVAASYRHKQARRAGVAFQDQDAVTANPHR